MRAFRERAQRKWFKSALSKLKKKRLEPSQQSSCCPKAGLWERAVTAPLSKDPVSSECSPKPNLPTPPAQLVLGNKRHPTPKGKWIYKPMPRLYGDERKCRLNKKKTFFLSALYWQKVQSLLSSNNRQDQTFIFSSKNIGGPINGETSLKAVLCIKFCCRLTVW